jgi:hypothetical protein
MVTNFMRPNDPPQVVPSLPERCGTDCIIIALDALIDRMVKAVNRVEAVLNSPDLQKRDLHTEEALHATVSGGNSILDAMHTKKRADDRHDYSGTRVIFEWKADKAFVESHTAMVMSEYEYAPSERVNPDCWSVVDISRHGACLERVSFKKPELGVGALVGISWLPHKNEPMLAFITWIKEPKHGEQRMGIRFILDKFRLMKGALIGGGSDETMPSRSWPLLVRRGKRPLTIFFPHAHVYRNMTFVIADEGKSSHFKIDKIVKTGPNYAIVRAAKPDELDHSQELDFN